MIKKRDALVLVVVLVAVGVVLGLSLVLGGAGRDAATEAPGEDITMVDTGEDKPEDAAVEKAEGAQAYLLVTVQGMQYEPILLSHETEYSLRQTDIGAENIIHVTPDSVVIQSSTCENQDCVDQGMVTLENMNSRFLQNMIVCLPNSVMLELVTTAPLEVEE